MAHDYAKRPRNGRKKKKTGISSGPIWLVTGLLCGLFLAFLLQLGGISLVPGRAAPIERPSAPIADSALNATDRQPVQVPKKPRFEFYSLLPEAEVEVLEEAEVPVVEHAPAAPLKSTTEQSTAISAGQKTAPSSGGTQYVLQAGSFKRLTDADSRRAQLLLMGLEANIEKVKLSAFDSRHRVQVGPFYTRSDMASARKLLAQEKIDTLLLERKTP